MRRSRPTGRVDVAATKSSPTDDVTEIDRACEELIRTRILTSRPDDGFVGEEGHDVPGTSGVEWIVDPIDGTVNFVYGIPAYAVSIAAAVEATVVAGYVVNVASGEEWAAVRGEGAWRLDGDERHRLVAPDPPALAHLLVGTGFHYVPEIRATQAAAVARLLPQVRDIRRIGLRRPQPVRARRRAPRRVRRAGPEAVGSSRRRPHRHRGRTRRERARR